MLVLLALAGIVYLDIQVRKRFEGERWALPAHVFSRPYELYSGRRIGPDALKAALAERGYRAVTEALNPGTFSVKENQYTVVTRPFEYFDGKQDSRRISFSFNANTISQIHAANGERADLVRLEPVLVGTVTAGSHEDRVLIKLHEAPEHLLNALLTIEDKRFMSHHGIDPVGLARAMLANVKSGAVVQGGSTITQQLVKNFYLTHARTLKRKFTEMVMAVLLELHYSKREILEAYLNEVFLGQSGNRAIHGFGLASEFYFGRPLHELRVHEAALLVGMIKAPSFYNPVRNPERARKRRNAVLKAMAQEGHLDQARLTRALAQEIKVKKPLYKTGSAHASFLDLVRRQLLQHFEEGDLKRQGLAIYSTLDPDLQQRAADSLAERLVEIEKSRGLSANTLQAAMMISRVETGELLAVVGGRNQKKGGFNRALDAVRPVGSLIKPAVYLSALSEPDRYNLMSVLQDKPVEIKQAGAPDWTPQNYDKKFHGDVSLVDALAKSLNLATVDLGMSVGVEPVKATLQASGIRRELEAYPSLFLGASNHSLLEMMQFYQTIANDGFLSPLRSIFLVADNQAAPIARYPSRMSAVFDPAAVHVLNYALQQVVKRGTAQAINNRFDKSLQLAGKTGTTDGHRDSWFAGYAGNYLAVVWVGRDDNKPTGLTGASGALRIWMDVMDELDLRPKQTASPDSVVWQSVDPATGLAADSGCKNVQELPFISGSEPGEFAPCAKGTRPMRDGITRWIKKFFSKSGNESKNKSREDGK